MAFTSGKKTVFVCVALAALAAAGAYLLNIRLQEAAVHRAWQLVRAVPAPHHVTVEAVSSGLFGRSVVLRGLRGVVVVAEDRYAFQIREMSLEGPAAAGEKSGSVRLVKTAVLHDVLVRGPDYTEKTAEYRLEDIRGDLPRVLAALKKLPDGVFAAKASAGRKGEAQDSAEEREKLRALGEFMLAAETLYAGAVLNRDSTVTQTMDRHRVTFYEGLGDWRQVSLRRTGRILGQDLRVGIDGADLCTMDRVSLESLALPSFGAVMMRKAAAQTDSADWRENLQGESFALKDLRIENFSMAGSNAPPTQFASLSLSLDGAVTEEKAFSFTASSRYDDVVLRAEPVNRAVESAFGLKGLFPAPLRLSGEWSLALAGRQRANGIDSLQQQLSLRLKGLAELNTAFTLEGVNLSPGDEAAKLKNFSLTVTDHKGSELFFSALAAQEGGTPQSARDKLASELEASALSAHPALQAALASGFAFLKTPGGTLNVSLHPQKPLSMPEALMMLVLAPEQMGLNASFTSGTGDAAGR